MTEPTQDDMERAGRLMSSATIRDGEDIRRLIAIGIRDGREQARMPFLTLLIRLDAYEGPDALPVAWLAEHVRAAAEET